MSQRGALPPMVLRWCRADSMRTEPGAAPAVTKLSDGSPPGVNASPFVSIGSYCLSWASPQTATVSTMHGPDPFAS